MELDIREEWRRRGSEGLTVVVRNPPPRVTKKIHLTSLIFQKKIARKITSSPASLLPASQTLLRSTGGGGKRQTSSWVILTDKGKGPQSSEWGCQYVTLGTWDRTSQNYPGWIDRRRINAEDRKEIRKRLKTRIRKRRSMILRGPTASRQLNN